MPPAEITWLGHSTVVIDLDGVRLVTDPVLRTRVAHLKRIASPTAEVDEVDVALISHVHYDHLDVPSLAQVRPLRLVVPAGAGRALRSHGFQQVLEVAQGDEVQCGPVTVRATPADHHAWRPGIARDTPALGYLVRGSVNVYFAGDTGLFDEMSAIAPGLDVALLPVAGWGLRIPDDHLDPVRAAEAARLLRPRLAVPIHWGTYRMIGLPTATAAMRAPADAFERLVEEIAPDVAVALVSPGTRLPITSAASPVPGDARRPCGPESAAR